MTCWLVLLQSLFMLIHDNNCTQCSSIHWLTTWLTWQKDTRRVGVRGTVAALTHLLTIKLVALSIDLQTGWLTKGHTWVGTWVGVGWQHSLIYWLRSWWALSADLQTGWLREGHTLGSGRERMVALAYLPTEKLMSTISWITDWLTDKTTHTG